MKEKSILGYVFEMLLGGPKRFPNCFMKEKSILGYVFEVLFESRTCEIAMLYPDGQCKMDYWVCLWIPKVNIVPTQKGGLVGRVSRGGARFLCVSPRVASVGDLGNLVRPR